MQQTVDRNGKQLGNLKIGFDKIFFAVKMCLNSDSSVVQSGERRTVNPYVTGSSPVRGANFLFSCILANLYLMLIQQVSVKTLLGAF